MTSQYSVTSGDREGVQITPAEEGTAVAKVAPSLGNNWFSSRTGGVKVLEPILFSDFVNAKSCG